MEKDSALYQLMDIRMNSVMSGITDGDGEYQAILRKSDIYSGELDWGSLATTPLVDFHHRLTACPSYLKRTAFSDSP